LFNPDLPRVVFRLADIRRDGSLARVASEAWAMPVQFTFSASVIRDALPSSKWITS